MMVEPTVATEPVLAMRACPGCGAIIPRNLKGRWSCGEVLDPRRRELKEAMEEDEE